MRVRGNYKQGAIIMTKTRDEIVEIGMTAVFNKPVQSVREGLEAAIDHLITAGVIPQPSECNKSTVHLVGTRNG